MVTVHSPITTEVLFQNASLVTPRRKLVTFTPLDEEELPKENDLIGLDAEFVTLNQVKLIVFMWKKCKIYLE